MDEFIDKVCLMLLFKNCPCEAKDREDALELYEHSAVLLQSLIAKFEKTETAKDLI